MRMSCRLPPVQDVRKAVLHSLPTAECSLAEVLERTRDVNDEVRLHASEPQKHPCSSKACIAALSYCNCNLSGAAHVAGQEAGVCVHQGASAAGLPQVRTLPFSQSLL